MLPLRLRLNALQRVSVRVIAGARLAIPVKVARAGFACRASDLSHLHQDHHFDAQLVSSQGGAGDIRDFDALSTSLTAEVAGSSER